MIVKDTVLGDIRFSTRIVSWMFLKLSARNKQLNKLPIGSMYDILTYISLIFMLNVGKYTVPPMDPSWARVFHPEDSCV